MGIDLIIRQLASNGLKQLVQCGIGGFFSMAKMENGDDLPDDGNKHNT